VGKLLLLTIAYTSISGVGQMEIITIELLVSDPSPFEVETSIAMLERN
jgi:hypothetical protein